MKKKIILLVTVLLVFTFVGSTVSAATSWSSAGFSTVKRYSTTTGYTFFVQRICEGNSVPCSIDGVWGSNTTTAVKAMQTNCGVTSDGVVGQNSWTAFNNKTVWGTDANGNEFWAGLDGSIGDWDQTFSCKRTTSGQWYTWTAAGNGGTEGLYQFK